MLTPVHLATAEDDEIESAGEPEAVSWATCPGEGESSGVLWADFTIYLFTPAQLLRCHAWSPYPARGP
jgi:hypothetical protein